MAIVGHGQTATSLLDAARGIVGATALKDVVALDAFAGEGTDQDLQTRVCDAIDAVDRGGGVLVILDVLGASPCQCAERGGEGHGVVVLAGLNLAMLLKLAVLDRATMSADALAQACADSGRRAVALRASQAGPSHTQDGANESAARSDADTEVTQ